MALGDGSLRGSAFSTGGFVMRGLDAASDFGERLAVVNRSDLPDFQSTIRKEKY